MKKTAGWLLLLVSILVLGASGYRLLFTAWLSATPEWAENEAAITTRHTLSLVSGALSVIGLGAGVWLLRKAASN